MAIAPPTDIVLDALMAADPLKSKAVAEQLSQLRPSRAGDFDTAMTDPAAPTTAATPQPAPAPAASMPRATARIDTAAVGRANIPPAFRKFEAFVLQTFIEAMLPHGSAVNFGKGVAGDVWRSMMAEQLGTAVANSGGVGIAKYLAAAHPVDAAAAGNASRQRPSISPPLVLPAGAPERSAAATMLDDLAIKA
jgi:peptidoglycan hydrolase FlgJ